MSGFFQSEIVRNIIMEMGELQSELIEKTFLVPVMNHNQKKEHIQLMKKFLEKQKNLYFRLSLSDDPEALEMKRKILETAAFLGMNPNQSMVEFFKDMENTLEKLNQISER